MFQVLLLLLVVASRGRVHSLSIIRYCRQLLAPSSTSRLANLFEAYDVIQEPSFLRRSRPAWDVFDGIASDVEVTEEGVVAGQGLVAKRAFHAGEVVALYPVHALGYARGREPPAAHEPSQRRHPPPLHASRSSPEACTIVGTSDLICFKDEARRFGVVGYGSGTSAVDGGDPDEEEGIAADVDYTYAMLDPSERYVFDVNPSRAVSSMFVAHFVNDAAAADFGARTEEGGIAFDAAVGTSLKYLETSLSGFNCVMTPFGPPPLMAYVTVGPVEAGSELLASYGLDYWLGKEFEEDDDEAMRKRLEGVPKVYQGIERAEDGVATALREAKAAVRSSRYAPHTRLLGETIADLMAVAEPHEKGGGPSLRGRWWRRIRRKGRQTFRNK